MPLRNANGKALIRRWGRRVLAHESLPNRTNRLRVACLQPKVFREIVVVQVSFQAMRSCKQDKPAAISK